MTSSQPAPPRWNVGDALGYGWARFRGEWNQLVLGVLLLVAGVVVAGGIGVALRAALVDVTSGIGVILLTGALGAALVVIAAQVLGAGFLRGALGVTEGRQFRARDVLSTEGAAPVVATSLIIGAATFAGTLLCYLPGLAVAFLTQWSLYFVIDRGLGPRAAIRASAALTTSRLTESLVWFLLAALVVAAGAAVCGVGLLVALPVVVLGGAYTYRLLTGQDVAA